MENVFDTLTQRGFIAQCTDPDEVRNLLGSRQVTFYIGFDPNAQDTDPLHSWAAALVLSATRQDALICAKS